MAEHTAPDHYLSDNVYNHLLDALTGLDGDTAHPHPLRDRIASVLGEVSGIWPASVRLEQAGLSKHYSSEDDKSFNKA